MTFKFKENQSVAAADAAAVPAEFQAFYTAAADGSLTVREDMSAAATAWDGMVHSNEAARAEVKVAKKGNIDLSPLSEFGSTPTEILATITSRTKEMSDAIEAKKGDVNPDKMRKQMNEAFETKEKALNGRIEGLQSQLYRELVTNELSKSVSLHKGDMHILLPILEKQVQVQDVDGKQIPMVMDAEGDIKRGATGLPMTMNELVESHKKDSLYKKLFEATAKVGSGPPPTRIPGAVQPEGQPTKASDDIAAGISDMM